MGEVRDTKGFSQKARREEKPNVIGIGSPYEPSIKSELCIRTAEQSVEPTIDQIINFLAIE